jgi:hypothetical protein
MLGLSLNIVKFANTKCHKVRRHDGSVDERKLLDFSAGKGFVGKFGHVAESIKGFGYSEGDGEDGFAGWFVPAGKCSSEF